MYVNGSDLLLMIGAKAAGHCTSHSATYSTESNEVAVKPAASAAASASLFKSKRVTGLSMQVKVDGLIFSGEAESGVDAVLAAWKNGTPVALKLFHRGRDNEPYATGNFIISSLEENSPAGQDSTYSATFDNDGAVTIDESKLGPETVPAG